MQRKGIKEGIAALAATGAVALSVLGAAGVASASPPPYHGHHHGHHLCIVVRPRSSGAFADNNDVLSGYVVRGSVSVVANQGTQGDNPPVTGFGPGTGYTVSYGHPGAVATLQPPYAGSNDGFVTNYAVFRPASGPGCLGGHLHYNLRARTSGAFSNNQDILSARNIVPGSVFVVANQGQSGDNPSVNGFANGNGYTVSYSRHGATATLDPPFAGSNDGFTTYYTVYFR